MGGAAIEHGLTHPVFEGTTKLYSLHPEPEAVPLQRQNYPLPSHPSVSAHKNRSYLTSVEKRLQSLEALVAQRLPDLNIDEAIAAGRSDDHTKPPLHSPQSSITSQSPSFGATTDVTAESLSPSTFSEAVPTEADGFDWREDVNDLADGMAALAVEPKGTGYLGSTAGVFFLRSLMYWMGNPPSIINSGPLSSLLDKQESFSEASSSWRLSQSLASRQVLSRLLDSYFSTYHPTYPFVHEQTFRAQFHEIVPRPRHRSWQMLLYTIIALGAWCLTDATEPGLDEDLYHQAVSIGEDESLFESANLTFVQAVALLSNLSQKRNKPNTGSNFLGLAVRMALSIGLHRELPDWNISIFQREMRRRAWWGLYLFDSGAGTTFGRPILLPGPEAMDVKHVVNVGDEYLTPGTITLPEESKEPTIYAGMQTQCDFHVHTNSMSNRLLSTGGVSIEDALSMNQTLDAWTDTLPPYFQLQAKTSLSEQWFRFTHARLWWRIWNIKIILFRQLLLKRAIERNGKDGKEFKFAPEPIVDKGSDVGINAAHATILSIDTYLRDAPLTRLDSWYSVYFLFHASLVIALAILGGTGAPELSTWQADIEIVQNILRHVLHQNPLSNRCADILNHLLPVESGGLGFVRDQIDPFNLDFSLWPTEQIDFFTSLGWPETSPGM